MKELIGKSYEEIKKSLVNIEYKDINIEGSRSKNMKDEPRPKLRSWKGELIPIEFRGGTEFYNSELKPGDSYMRENNGVDWWTTDIDYELPENQEEYFVLCNELKPGNLSSFSHIKFISVPVRLL